MRIFSICDPGLDIFKPQLIDMTELVAYFVFDAVTRGRSYRNSWSMRRGEPRRFIKAMAKIPFERLSFAVVEDNIHMRRLIRTLLYSFGSREIYEAEDGASGLEAVEMYSPDILITDWMMPIFDGLEFIQMIRNPEGCTNAYIPIIMLTGHCERRRVSLARDAGVTEFLCKPFSAKGLYERIEHIIFNPRPFVRNADYFGPQIRESHIGNSAQTRNRQSNKGSIGVLEETDVDGKMLEHI